MGVKRIPGKGGEMLHTALKTLDNKVGKAGWFESAKYNDKHSTPVAYVASIQEFGAQSHHIPPRPFLRPTIAEQRENWKKIMAGNAKKVLQGEMTSFEMMEDIGLTAAGDFRKAISKLTDPPLSAATLLARKYRRDKGKSTKGGNASNKPLVDTGHMLATCTNSVEEK